MNTHVKQAKERREKGDTEGWSWVFFHCMTQQDRKDFDKELVDQKDPLAYQPGTTEQRFRYKVNHS